MQFLKLNILVVLLIFSLYYASSDDSYEDAQEASNDRKVDDSAEGSDGGGDGSAEADDFAGHTEEGRDYQHSGDHDVDDSVDNDNSNETDNDSNTDASAGGNDDHKGGMDFDTSVADSRDLNSGKVEPGCKKGVYYWDDCNICFCYKQGLNSCTTAYCGNKGPLKLKLNGGVKKKATYKKLRAVATGCVPGEKVNPKNNCVCDCVIPSVISCPNTCFV